MRDPLSVSLSYTQIPGVERAPVQPSPVWDRAPENPGFRWRGSGRPRGEGEEGRGAGSPRPKGSDVKVRGL